jgi:lipopolysaccharide biosynthesis glycosyltransferase
MVDRGARSTGAFSRMPKRNAIVFAVDSKLFPAAVFQAARLNALGGRADTDIVIASDSAADFEVAKASGVPFRPWPVAPGTLAEVRMYGKRLPAATYYRVFLPKLLGGEYARLLYMDVDIYIHRKEVFGLFDLDLAGNSLAAVRDPLPWRGLERELAELRRTTKNREQKYLNAGVLLIDPAAFAEQRVERRVLKVSAEQPLWLNDQSALNIVLDGRWLELSPAFNMLVEFWPTFVPKVCDPAVVHFIGTVKPWHGARFREAHPVKAAMEAFFPASPWPRFLTGFYNFEKAMQDLRQGIPEAALPGETPFEPARSPAYLDYLRNTRFADVEARLTSLRLENMPATAGTR